MEYIKLGRTGLEVSRICLGCMSYGSPASKTQPWALDERASRPFITQALEAGINFFDTANVYSGGASEEVVGGALKELAKRDEIVLATKVWGRMRPGPNGAGLSRKAIFMEMDASLRRLGTDYVDLYQIHRWDDSTPIEETMEALHDLVKAGKTLHRGLHHVCVAVRQSAVCRREESLDAFCVDAEFRQSHLSRGGAGNASLVQGRGHRCDSLEPAGAWAPGTALGIGNQPFGKGCVWP
jgi:aryl-alcohol dehydrogenase-like predicted oxidoreductase